MDLMSSLAPCDRTAATGMSWPHRGSVRRRRRSGTGHNARAMIHIMSLPRADSVFSCHRHRGSVQAYGGIRLAPAEVGCLWETRTEVVVGHAFPLVTGLQPWDFKSIARASKVRSLHLPPCAERPAELTPSGQTVAVCGLDDFEFRGYGPPLTVKPAQTGEVASPHPPNHGDHDG